MFFATDEYQNNWFSSLSPAVKAIIAGLLLGLLSGSIALALVMTEPLLVFIGVLALCIGLLALTNLDFALITLIAVTALLPFGTLPFQVAFTPSLIDTALGVFLLVYVFQWMTGRRHEFKTSPVQLFISMFIMVMLFAFVRGIANAPLTPGVLRRFTGLMLNVGLALILVDVIRTTRTLRYLVLTFIGVGSMSALIGIVLWVLPDDTAEALLNRLGRIGYPVGGVIRYREDGVQILGERAIGTWIDPNAFGGFLMMVGALTAPQILSRRPVTGYRWLALGFFALIFTALFLTDSRGSMLGLAAGLGIVALVRYRQLVWWMLAAAVLALLLPITQDFIDRLLAGFTGADLETQMRLGEYGDALRLISRYPVLGVGFSAPPDIDLYIGFASTYLTITANAGLIGLLAFLIAVGSVFRYGYQKRAAIAQNQALVDVWLGLAAGIIGALVGGIFDHFYFNIDFQATALTFWLFVGLLLATTRLAAPPDEREEFDMPHVPRVNQSHQPDPNSAELPPQKREPMAEPVPGGD